MKKALLLGVALMFVASSVSAQYMGLYLDLDHSVNFELDAGMVTVYLFAYRADGMKCVELSTTASNDNAFFGATTYHPDAMAAGGGNLPNDDILKCWASCKFDWTWMCYAQLMMTSSEPMIISIGRHSASDLYPKLADCTLPYAVEYEAFPLTNVCLNLECGDAVEESSWGAIKNLYE